METDGLVECGGTGTTGAVACFSGLSLGLGLWFRVSGFGFRVWGLRLGFRVMSPYPDPFIQNTDPRSIFGS